MSCSTPFGITARYTPPSRHGAVRMNDVLNAFRHHGSVHQQLAASSRQRQPGAQRLSASRLDTPGGDLRRAATPARCSTPFGITARYTSRSMPLGYRLRRADVLNAFRHHGSIHRLAVAAASVRRGGAQRLSASRLDTPAGLTRRAHGRREVLNAFRHHGSIHPRHLRHGGGARPGAQRLSASRLDTQDWFAAVQGHSDWYAVLNAFRHHGSIHTGRTRGSGSRHECSTPFGITDRYHSGRGCRLSATS